MSHNRATTEVPPRPSMVSLATSFLANSSMTHILGAPREVRQALFHGTPSGMENTMEHMNWNQRITIAREDLEISKSEFSRRVGVSTATTADWETGTIKKIDGWNLVKAAEVLGVTPEWLMTGKGGKDARAVEVEFAWVYRHATDRGRRYLLDAIGGTRAAYMEKAPAVHLSIIKKNDDDEKTA